MPSANLESNNCSIYSEEEYEEIGKYGKEIFVPNNNIDNLIINEIGIKSLR